MSEYELPSVRAKLRALVVSPSGHFLANAIALTWVLVTDVEQTEFNAVSGWVAAHINSVAGNHMVNLETVANVFQWTPVAMSLLLDLASSFRINAALLEYKGQVRAAVNKARGGVQGDISNVPEDEKEAIFSVLEHWELKSVRDAFALLRRHLAVATVSLCLWAAVFVAPAFPALRVFLPSGMEGQLSIVIVAKALVLVYWLYYNVQSRPVRLHLFRVE